MIEGNQMIGKRRLDNISLKINLRKRNFPEEQQKVVSDFSKYVKKAGVWACYGLKKDDLTRWVCLNVGQSNDIGTEMRVNRKYTRGKFNNKKGIYKNYKGEVVFTFDRQQNKPITTRQWVWSHIGENYTSLYFVIVCESLDKDERLKTEEKYAKDNNALYWNPAPGQ